MDGARVPRTLLHIAVDWPGHFPNGADTVAILIAAGATAMRASCFQVCTPPAETALHWAAAELT